MSDIFNILMCTLAFDSNCIMFNDVTSQTRFDLEKPIATQVLFTKPSSSLPHSQKGFADPNVAPNESSVHNHIPYV